MAAGTKCPCGGEHPHLDAFKQYQAHPYVGIGEAELHMASQEAGEHDRRMKALEREKT